MWYFNSLRELGYAKTLIYTFIQQFIPSLARRNEISGAFTNQNNKVQELTSHANESDLAAINKNLELMWKPSIDFSKKNQNVPVDILLSTNMISVGVDIPRLGLMVITGQPKNTAEYIQASSRVGRGKDGTGLIFTLYNHARSRDRSHFENFKTFHQSFYQHVEPSSITPISSKSRERCLGALIIG
ncbi:helicase-related protein, partial [Alphaproteobacteria bacterium]|nr:helicase-related protein [Alphaproteobacteria bacterium]